MTNPTHTDPPAKEASIVPPDDPEADGSDCEPFEEHLYSFSLDGKSITANQYRELRKTYKTKRKQNNAQLPSRPTKKRKRVPRTIDRDDTKYEFEETGEMIKFDKALTEHGCMRPFCTPQFRKILFTTSKTLIDRLFQQLFLVKQVLNHLAETKNVKTFSIKKVPEDIDGSIRPLLYQYPGLDDYYTLFSRVKPKKSDASKKTKKSEASKKTKHVDVKAMLDSHGFGEEWESWRISCVERIPDNQLSSPDGETVLQKDATIERYLRGLVALIHWHATVIVAPDRPKGSIPKNTKLKEDSVMFYYCPAKSRSRRNVDEHVTKMKSFYRKLLKATTIRDVVHKTGETLDKFLKFKRGEWLHKAGYCNRIDHTGTPLAQEDDQEDDQIPFAKEQNLDSMIRCLWDRMQCRTEDKVYVFSRLDLRELSEYYVADEFYEQFLVEICESHFVLPAFFQKGENGNPDNRETGGTVVLPCDVDTLGKIIYNMDVLHEHYHITITFITTDSGKRQPQIEMERYRTALEVFNGTNIHKNKIGPSSLSPIKANVVMIQNPNFGASSPDDESDCSFSNGTIEPLSDKVAENPIWKILIDLWYDADLRPSESMEADKSFLYQGQADPSMFVKEYGSIICPKSKRKKLKLEVVRTRLKEAAKRFRLAEQEQATDDHRLYLVNRPYFGVNNAYESEEFLPKPPKEQTSKKEVLTYAPHESNIRDMPMGLMKNFPNAYFGEIFYLPESNETAEKIVANDFLVEALPEMAKWGHLPPKGKLFVPTTVKILDLVIKIKDTLLDNDIQASIFRAENPEQEELFGDLLGLNPVSYKDLKGMDCMKPYLHKENDKGDNDDDDDDFSDGFDCSWLSFENISERSDESIAAFTVPWKIETPPEALASSQKRKSKKSRRKKSVDTTIRTKAKLREPGSTTGTRTEEYTAEEFSETFELDGPIYLRHKNNKGTVVLRPPNDPATLQKLYDFVLDAHVMSPKFRAGQLVTCQDGTKNQWKGVVKEYTPEESQMDDALSYSTSSKGVKGVGKGRKIPAYEVLIMEADDADPKQLSIWEPDILTPKPQDPGPTFKNWLMEQPKQPSPENTQTEAGME